MTDTSTLESGASLIRSSNYGGNRYQYDWGMCSYDKGFAQIDTDQDASYYGTWTNPFTRIILNYCEGDVSETYCPTDEIYVAEIRRLQEWCNGRDDTMKIDAMCNESMVKRFTELGLSDVLH